MQFERNYEVGDPKDPPLNVAALGDSFTTGYGVVEVTGSLPYQIGVGLADEGYCVRIRNLAESGAYLRDVAASQIPSIEDEPIDILLVFVGGMDTTHLTSIREYRLQFIELMEVLQRLPARQVLVSGSPDMSGGPAFPWVLKRLFAAQCRQENALVRSLIGNFGVTHVDVYGSGKLSRQHYSADGDHPNVAGYKVWAALFLDALETSAVTKTRRPGGRFRRTGIASESHPCPDGGHTR